MHSKWLLTLVAALALFSAAPATVRAAVVLASSDAYVTTEFPDGNHGADSQLWIKNAAPGAFQRKAHVRFDLSSFGSDPVGLATFNLHVSNSLGQGLQGNIIGQTISFNVFGLNDGDVGENWDESAITWNNAPQNDTTSGDGLLANTTLLGSFDIFETGIGSSVSFSSAALTSFVNNDTDDLLTLVVVRDFLDPDISGYVHQFDAREAGDSFAPSLELTRVVPEPASIAVWACLGLTAAGVQWRRGRRVSAVG